MTTPIDRVIELLKCYTINNNREQLAEAHSLLEKYLDYSGSGGANLKEERRTSVCVDCGVEFHRLSSTKVRCDKCREKRKLQWQKDYYQRKK